MGGLCICRYRKSYSFLMLALNNISKSFPGVKALQHVTLTFRQGEVHALCGENGAGKSTLMNIISGNLQPDSGTIMLNGQPVIIENVLQAENAGIAIVYQERSLVDSLTVAENIFPVNQPKTSFGLIDYRALHANTTALLGMLRLSHLSPGTIAGKLSAAQKGMIEIAKALAKKPAVLILDEPTASLTHEETALLFSIIKNLKQAGVAIIYISHRMAEIAAIADTVSVLKDGALQGTVAAATPVDTIVQMMVGRTLGASVFGSNVTGTVLLHVEELSGKEFSNISFKVHGGEILGFAGLTGSGRTALAKTIFGDSKYDSGQMLMNGKPFHPKHPGDAIASHIAYLPDERKTEGLFLEKSITENIASAHLDTPVYDQQASKKLATQYIGQLTIRTPGPGTPVRKLSGGNQQKTVLAKWLSVAPELLIVNEPTHGVDVGAKAEIYHILKDLTAKGKGIILISSELPELLLLADRIAVMYQGRLMDILLKREATEERLAALTSGIQ